MLFLLLFSHRSHIRGHGVLKRIVLVLPFASPLTGGARGCSTFILLYGRIGLCFPLYALATFLLFVGVNITH
jgi:hypothetical protein